MGAFELGEDNVYVAELDIMIFLFFFRKNDKIYVGV